MRPTLHLLSLALLLTTPLLFAQSKDHWKHEVSASDRARTNPVAAQPGAIDAGAKLYNEHCSRCHGDDANGRGKKPTLRGTDIATASDGELFWMLKNGDLLHSMPAWTSLPEIQRWQIISYIRSLQLPAAATTTAPPK